MFFLKSKKGAVTEMSLAHIQDIGLVALAIILLVSFVYKASSGEFIDEKKVVINTGLLIDSLLSTNGDTSVYTTISNHTVSITDKHVEAGKKWAQRFHLLEDPNINIFSDLLFENTTIISLLKTGNTLYVSKEVINANYHNCPFILVDIPKNITIITETEDLFISQLEQALYQLSSDHGINLEITDNLTKSTELAIIIKSTNEEKLKLEIPPHSAGSRRLACAITNKILIKNPELSTKISPIEKDIFEKSENSIIIYLKESLRVLDTTIALSNGVKSTFT